MFYNRCKIKWIESPSSRIWTPHMHHEYSLLLLFRQLWLQNNIEYEIEEDGCSASCVKLHLIKYWINQVFWGSTSNTNIGKSQKKNYYKLIFCTSYYTKYLLVYTSPPPLFLLTVDRLRWNLSWTMSARIGFVNYSSISVTRPPWKI